MDWANHSSISTGLSFLISNKKPIILCWLVEGVAVDLLWALSNGYLLL